ncbi:MAG: LacI family DNA-binding transcriptional regulator [Acholeplasma sp.]|nr:LacI family DNA-binding transcriptional regulator [Acholeplasma sp.]
MPPTIKDVARIAQVSITTVSKVINNHPSISEKTANRVKEVIKEINYTPNLRARNFASKKTMRVAFVAHIKVNTAFINPHLFEIMIGCQKHLHNNNYQMEFIGLKSGDFDQEIKYLIDSKSVDGVIVHVSALTIETSRYLIKTNFPHVVIGEPNFSSSVCWIDNNNEFSGRLAAKHLIDIGVRKIAYLGGSKKDQISETRLLGIKIELMERKINIMDDHIINTNSTYEDSYNKTQEFINNIGIPEAIICANNTIVLGCMDALNNLEIAIPKEVAVVTFDDYPYAVITKPPTTSINIDVFDLGKQAAQFLLNKIRKPNYWFQTYVTSPLLVVRKTTQSD